MCYNLLIIKEINMSTFFQNPYKGTVWKFYLENPNRSTFKSFCLTIKALNVPNRSMFLNFMYIRY